MVHSYCLTAKIIQTKRIFCQKCDEYYQLHLRHDKVSLIGQFFRYLIILIGVFALGASICIIDGYLKCKPSGTDGLRSFTSRMSLTNSSVYDFVQDCVDMGTLLRIQAIIMPICLWSLYYSIIGQRSKVSDLYTTIETLAKCEDKTAQIVSRNQAKKNLHMVRQNNAGHKIENVIFDRFWYKNREDKQRRERMIKRQIAEENMRQLKQNEIDFSHQYVPRQSYATKIDEKEIL